MVSKKHLDSETWEKVWQILFIWVETITLVLSLLNTNDRCDKYRISRISVLWSLRQRHRQVRLKTPSRKWRKAPQTLGVGRIQRRWKHHTWPVRSYGVGVVALSYDIPSSVAREFNDHVWVSLTLRRRHIHHWPSMRYGTGVALNSHVSPPKNLQAQI